MKGLRKYLTPFAPDQSGAVSVLYELGGILVICDAGGCVGNVCGFDEPRWFTKKSAIFSAGLRDMDAILGRDDRLVAKLSDAAGKLEASFAAIIGTPVPAVIGTDYKALGRMTEKKTSLPVMTVDTNGMELYDVGQEKAYLALFKTFAREQYPVEQGRIGVIGATPQDVSDLQFSDKIKAALAAGSEGGSVICYGMGDGLDAVKMASAAEKNLVVSPSGLAAARYLKERFGTPYEAGYPLAADMLPADISDYAGKKVLIVHQQVIANALRDEICARGGADVTVCSWFDMKPELKADGDISLKEEDDFTELVKNNSWDVIFADGCMARMIPDFSGEFVDTVHFAVSGKLPYCRQTGR